MTYQVLARRLRPQRFAEVVGQEHVTRTLQAAIAVGRIAHAFLFAGPRGVGKTTTARLLAKALNCERGVSQEPCNECANCREIAEGRAFDVLEIDGASHTQVDKMRDLMETVAHQPIRSRFKIFIIDEVHMLSQHSFNALLKTLEEPPPHVKFIFATTDPHKVLATVLSRCQRYDLRRIGLGQLLAELPEAEAEALRVQAERRSADDLQRFFRLLLEADETLAAPARTVDPQLVLEMAVLRLATLPPLLPVDDILRRLEALGAGSPASDSAAPSGPERVAAPAGEGLWEQFLARVRDDKVSLYLALATGKLVGADDASIRIGIDNEAMRRDIGRPETLARLGAIAGKIWGRELRVEIGPVPAEQAADTPLGRARRKTEATLAGPLVQAAVEIFGGEVRGVRDRRER